jgi:hypothetical protein
MAATNTAKIPMTMRSSIRVKDLGLDMGLNAKMKNDDVKL